MASQPPSRSITMKFSGMWSGVTKFLFPHRAERDPGFRREVRRLSVRSLYIIAAVCFGVPLTSMAFHGVTQLIEPYPGDPGYWSVIPFLIVAAALVGAAEWEWGRRHARVIALLSGFISAALLTWFEFLGNPKPEEAQLSSLINVVIVQLVAVAAIPALPMQILGLGAANGWFHWFSAKLAVHWGMIPPVSLHHYAGMDIVTLLCTALAAVSYQRIHESYSSHQREMETQSQLLVSENAASMGRFAATLSHELNTPLGVIISAIDSIRALTVRKPQASGAERDRLERVEIELLESAAKSSDHLQSVLIRMRRFTNLDRADVMPVDLAEMLRDVTAMLEPETSGKIQLDLDCEPLPPLTVRPQQMSAVFANLLHNAVVASGDKGRIAIIARKKNTHVEVAVKDAGRGLTPRELAFFFEPGFKITGGRVMAGHWSLFSSRQVVREHGGDIRVSSAPGQGTEVTVVLPRETNLL
jgi:signal transduction histidine kinase